jgi:hypothetical protein
VSVFPVIAHASSDPKTWLHHVKSPGNPQHENHHVIIKHKSAKHPKPHSTSHSHRV